MTNPLTQRVIPSQALRFTLIALSFVLPLVLSVMTIVYLTRTAVKSTNETVSEIIIEQVEAAIASSDDIYRPYTMIVDQPCVTLDSQLSNLNSISLYLHSLNIYRGRSIVCSSANYMIGRQLPDEKQFQGDFLFMTAKSNLEKDIPILLHRITQKPDAGIVLLLDARYLTTMLKYRVQVPKAIILQVGKQWVESHGLVKSTEIPDLMLRGESRSNRYPVVKIIAGTTQDAFFEEIWYHHQYTLFFALLFSIASAIICFSRVNSLLPVPKVLIDALKRDEFIPFVQPIVNPQGKWIGGEVLMRWRTANGTLIPPNLFIPTAEETGLIVPITSAMFRRLADELEPNLEVLPQGFYLSVNICKAHFDDMTLLDDCQKFLARFPAGRIRLYLELTEREEIPNTPLSEQLLSRLRDMGIKIAIDDFGTGHSTFDYLQRFNIDILKIDQRFVAAIGSQTLSVHLIEVLIYLAKRLSITLIAEGVETEAQRAYLTKHSVDAFQGYLFAKPMAIPDLLRLASENREEALITASESPLPAV